MSAARKGIDCSKCGHHFRDTFNLKKHLARKTPCAPIIGEDDLPEEQKDSPNKCRFCGRAFASAQSMRRHVRQACKIAPREGNPDGMEKLYEYTLRRQMETMKAEIENLKAQVAQSSAAAASTALTKIEAIPPATVVQTAHITNNIDRSVGKTINTANITINVFERENLDRVTRQQVWDLLRGLGPVGDNVKAIAEKAIIQAAMLVFSDPERPENITCYLPNKKGDDALVHGEKGWEVQPVSLVISPMAAQSIELLFKHQPGMGDKFEARPKEDVDWVMTTCGDIMRYIAKNEGDLTNEPPRGEFRGILIRNKDLLQQVLAKLPVAGNS